MARKSRKNMMPQAAVQEAVQQNEKELLRTAAYINRFAMHLIYHVMEQKTSFSI